MSEFHYGWTNDAHTTAHSYLLPHVEEWISSLAVTSIADIGAGNGSIAVRLSSSREVICFEPSEDGFAHIIGNPRLQKAVMLGVYDDCPSEFRSYFDAAYSLEVIEHLQLPAKLFGFASQLLRPGGKLLVTTPYHGYLKNLAISVLNKWDTHANPFWDEGHIRFFSIKTLTAMGEAQGFSVGKISRLGRIPSLAKSMAIEFTKT